MSLLLGLARSLADGVAGAPPRQWPAGGGPSAQAAAPGNRFLVNLSAGIGDALMALPMVRALKTCRPQCEIVLLATPANASLLQAEPGIAGIIPWPTAPTVTAVARLAGRLRASRFDAAICTLPSDLVSTSIALRCAGIPLRIKHRLDTVERCRDWQFFYTDLVATRPEKHKVVENLALLAPAGLCPPARTAAELATLMRLTLGDDERRGMQARFPVPAPGVARIGMHPGCKPGWEFKRWDPRRFAALADLLASGHGAEIFWFGGADEAALVDSIMRAVGVRSVSVAGRLSVREAAVLMSTCSAFVSNDSGPMHMATAAGVPTVALFSSANPRTLPARTGPYGPDHLVVARPDLQDITPEEVAAAVASILMRAARHVD